MLATEEIASLKEARDKGVAYLNENHLGWKDKVDKDGLDMLSGMNCVLGQLYGDFHEYLWEHNLTRTWAEEHGFFIPGYDEEQYYPRYTVLENLWKEIL